MKKTISHLLIYSLLFNSVYAVEGAPTEPPKMLKSEEIRAQLKDKEAFVGSLFETMKKNQDRLNLELSQVEKVDQDDLASNLILHDIARQVELCKNSRTKSLRGDVVEDPDTKEKIDCAQFGVLEMKIQQARDQKSFQANEVLAFKCATKGYENGAQKLALANQLQRIGVLSRDLKDYLPELCPSESKKETSCSDNFQCGFYKMLPDLILPKEKEDYKRTCKMNIEANGWQCIADMLKGFISGLLSDVNAIKQLGSAAIDTVKGWFSWGTKKADRDLTLKQIVDAEANEPVDGQNLSFTQKVTRGIANFFSEIGRSINQSLGSNFACLDKDSEGENCKEPVLGFGCATCSQKIRMMCGIGGFIGKEVVLSAIGGFVLGVFAKTARGAVQLTKHTGKALHLDDAGRFVGSKVANLGKAALETPIGLKLSGYVTKGMGKTSSLTLQGKNFVLNLGNKGFKFADDKMDALLKILSGNPVALGAWKLSKGTVKGALYVPGKLLQKTDDLFGYSYALGSRGITGVKAIKGAKLRLAGDKAVDLINQGKLGDNISPALKSKIDEYNELLRNSRKIDEELAEVGAKVKSGAISEQEFINLSTRAEQIQAKLASTLEDIGKQAKGEIKAAERALAAQQKLEAQEAKRQLELDFKRKAASVEPTSVKSPDASSRVTKTDMPASASVADEVPVASKTVDSPIDDVAAGSSRAKVDVPESAAAKAVEPGGGQLALDLGSDVKLLPAPSAIADDIPLSTVSVADEFTSGTGAAKGLRDEVPVKTERPVTARGGRKTPDVSTTKSVGAVEDVIEFQRPGDLIKTQGTIVSRTDEIVKVKTPSGSIVEIRADQIGKSNIKNLFETSNIPAIAGKKAGDALDLTTNGGRTYKGVVEQVNAKSVRMKLDDGQVITLRTRDLDLPRDGKLKNLPVVKEETKAAIDNVTKYEVPDSNESIVARESLDDVAVKPSSEPVQLELDLGLPDKSFVAAYGASQIDRFGSMSIVADRALDVTDASGKVHKGMKLERVYHEENRLVHIYKGPNGELLEIDLAKGGLIVDMEDLNKGVINYLDPRSAKAKEALKDEKVHRLVLGGKVDEAADAATTASKRYIDDIPVIVAKGETIAELKDLPKSKNLLYRLDNGKEFRGRFLRTEGDDIIFVTTKGEIIRIRKNIPIKVWIGSLPIRIAVNGSPVDSSGARNRTTPPPGSEPAKEPGKEPARDPANANDPPARAAETPAGTSTSGEGEDKTEVRVFKYDPTKGGRAIKMPGPLIIPPDGAFFSKGGML